MGWDFHNNAKEKHQIVESILRDMTWTSDHGSAQKVILHRVVGSHLWLAIEQIRTVIDGAAPLLNRINRFVMLCLLEKYKHRDAWGNRDAYLDCWGYKSMDESMHPYYYDCPLSVIKAAGPTNDPKAQEWRCNVDAMKRRKKESKSLFTKVQIGDLVSFHGMEFLYKVTSQKPFQGLRRLEGPLSGEDIFSPVVYKLPKNRLKSIV